MNAKIQKMFDDAKQEMNAAVHSAKKHPATLTIIAAGIMFVLGYMLGGNNAVIILDNMEPQPYKPGIVQLYHTEFPPIKPYQDPLEADIFCVDGEKVLLFSSFASVKLDGRCK